MSTSSQTDTPEYAPFFGAMGAASAIIFSGEFCAFLGFDALSKRTQDCSVFYKFSAFLGFDVLSKITHQNLNNSALG